MDALKAEIARKRKTHDKLRPDTKGKVRCHPLLLRVSGRQSFIALLLFAEVLPARRSGGEAEAGVLCAAQRQARGENGVGRAAARDDRRGRRSRVRQQQHE